MEKKSGDKGLPGKICIAEHARLHNGLRGGTTRPSSEDRRSGKWPEKRWKGGGRARAKFEFSLRRDITTRVSLRNSTTTPESPGEKEREKERQREKEPREEERDGSRDTRRGFRLVFPVRRARLRSLMAVTYS